MKILSIILLHLRNSAHFQFHTSFVELVTKIGAETLKIKQLFDAYLLHYKAVDEALKKITKSAVTAEIREADRERDRLFRGLADTNKAALNHFDPQVKAAAKRLKIVLDTYGNVAPKPLDEETSDIYNLMQDLTSSKYAQDAAKVGLTNWIKELEQSNKTFNKLMTGRDAESAEKTDLVLRKCRKDLDGAYRAIIKRVSALVEIEGEKEYRDFIRNLNIIITRYSNVVAQRAGKSKKTNNASE